LLIVPLAGIARAAEGPPPTLDQVLNSVVLREHRMIQQMRDLHPLIETYIQVLDKDSEGGFEPEKDQYFIGKLDVGSGVAFRPLVSSKGSGKQKSNFFTGLFSGKFQPDGFARMVFLDRWSFDRNHYGFEFVRREFLGEVRCLVFDVTPKDEDPRYGRFFGRIWVDDEEFAIVRFNGTYVPSTFANKYTHFDSWRVRTGPNRWLPAYIYSEESDFKASPTSRMRFKAQTRIWGYDVSGPSGQDEFTKLMVEAPNSKDATDVPDDLAPVGSQRAWERMAEENIINRMTNSGLLAPEGEVDRVLETVVNNLEVTNDLDIQPPVRCRVLLTAPIESFTVGHTIVLSRGLIDVLPDEATLAMFLSHELAHVTLGHRLDTKYAFNDRLLFQDEEAFQRLSFRRNPAEERAADQRGFELLSKSPYKDKLAGAGLFLEQLRVKAPALPSLIRPHLGDRLADGRDVLQMNRVRASAPKLEPERTDQIAALPIGSRIKVDPWSAKAEMLKNKPVALVSTREKMVFEVTPFLPYLTRAASEPGVVATDGAAQPPAEAPNGP